MTTDIIIIGAGPGGYETAAEAAANNLNVVLVERAQIGGTCLNRGCIPTKALLRSAEVADIVRRAEEFGINANINGISFAKAAERKESIVGQLRENVASLLKNAGVNVVTGDAVIVGPREVKVGDTVITASRAIIVATGSEPSTLPIEGAALTINSDTLLSLSQLPKTMTIIGGGVIGLEFAGILNSFGTGVTVVEYCQEILPNFDRDIARRLRSALSRRGVKFITNAAVTAVAKADDGNLSVIFSRKGKTDFVTAETVLMAVGRKPVLPDGIADVGVNIGRRGIEVDDKMRTSVAGIYAIGDVNGKCLLAHAASAQGRVALADILGKNSEINLSVIPSAVFTSPEAAMVGLTEEAANAEGREFFVSKSTFYSNGKAVTLGETDGIVKILHEKVNKHVIGCHILGPHASDIITEVTLAISARIPYTDILNTIHSHPTLSEAISSAL